MIKINDKCIIAQLDTHVGKTIKEVSEVLQPELEKITDNLEVCAKFKLVWGTSDLRTRSIIACMLKRIIFTLIRVKNIKDVYIWPCLEMAV